MSKTKFSCPYCGENRIDYLIITDDSCDVADCTSCGTRYEVFTSKIISRKLTFEVGMSASEAIKAIEARLTGKWDSPDLKKIGALSDTKADIMYIISLVNR